MKEFAGILLILSCAGMAEGQSTVGISFNFNGLSNIVGNMDVPQPKGLGTLAPFGSSTSIDNLFGGAPGDTFTFTLANGNTITSTVVLGGHQGFSEPVTGTITGGTGLFTGATGTYQATFTFVNPGQWNFTGTGSITVPNNPAGVTVLPDSLTFAPEAGASLSQPLILTNSGISPAQFSASASTTTGGNWLSISAASGTVMPLGSSSISVTVNTAGLQAGLYQGQVSLSLGVGTLPIPIPIQLIAGGKGGIIQLSQTGLSFTESPGGPAPSVQPITVFNSGVGDLTGLTATSSVTGSGPSWLTTTLSPPQSGSRQTSIAVSVSPSQLSTGNYYGRIDFALPGAANSPQSVAVVLQVLDGPAPDVLPGVINLLVDGTNGQTPYAAPPPQTITLKNPGTQPMTFTATAAYVVVGGTSTSVASWLQVTPASGTLGAGSSATLQVSMAPGCASALGCNLQEAPDGIINVALASGAATWNLGVPVNFAFEWPQSFQPGAAGTGPPPGVNARDRTVKHATTLAACALIDVFGGFISLPVGFQSTVGLPTPLLVSILDSCGDPMDTGTVVASFSSGDPSLPLIAIGNGEWSGTWTPHGSGVETITVQAVEPSGIFGAFSVSGTVAANNLTPIIGYGGVASAAGSPHVIAPGEFIAIYGLNLGATASSPTPLESTLGGTQVLIGGQPIPLDYVSKDQIDAIVPFNMTPDSIGQVIVLSGNAYSQPVAVTLGAAQPVVFSQDQSGTGPGAILVQPAGKSSTALNTESNPAHIGDALLIFCTGLGTVSPAVPAGTIAPSSNLANTDNPVAVTVGGIATPTLFAGLAPGFVGLYQVNVRVPSGVAPSSEVPVVLTAAGASSPAVTIAVK